MKAKKVTVKVHLPLPDSDALSLGLTYLVRTLELKKLAKPGWGGGFGGQYGYGHDFENDVFEMRYDRQFPECDCGGSQPIHTADCAVGHEGRSKWVSDRLSACSVPDESGDPSMGHRIEFEKFAEWEKDHPFPSCSCGAEAAWLTAHNLTEIPDQDWGGPRDFSHTHNCDWSVIDRPNFTDKISGFAVSWYKYIGRSMEPGREITFGEWNSILSRCLRSIGSRGSLKIATSFMAKQRERETNAWKDIVERTNHVVRARVE